MAARPTIGTRCEALPGFGKMSECVAFPTSTGRLGDFEIAVTTEVLLRVERTGTLLYSVGIVKRIQMAYIVQAVVLLVSGVYYPTTVLPAWMQALSTISPATYVIEGMRMALLDGADLLTLWPKVWPALVVGVLSVPLGLRLFVEVERYAKRTGRLKRSG